MINYLLTSLIKFVLLTLMIIKKIALGIFIHESHEYPKHTLHIYVKNVHVMKKNEVVLNI